MRKLECLKVTHSYDGVYNALCRVSLTVEAGQVLALIGPNGAGKSTTLRILATLQRPDAGEVLWDGRDAWAARYEVRRRVGFLGDGTAVYPGMTAAGYLRFFAECYGMRDAVAEVRVHELLEQFELMGKASARISDLSKGMRQRVAIARTLVHSPELLLLDEPADGLDPSARRRLREILRQTADAGVAIVISSHVLRELDGFCDTVALIRGGELELFGGVTEVIDRYEVRRRVHELEVWRGLDRAIEVLERHRGLIEEVVRTPVVEGEGAGGQGVARDGGRIRVRVHGEVDAPARLLKELVDADVEILAMHKVRGDLEDVYRSIGRDEAS
ncbi:MAG: ABC transporter ATP-binding protein [Nannocystaceae bacterium]